MVKFAKFADIEVPVPGFGAMGMSAAFGPSNDEESLKVLKHAVDIGCTFWDSAVVYGSGHNESLLGRFFSENPGAREKVFIASKCGFDCMNGGGYSTVTNKPEHIAEYIEGTKSRLGSYPDLYYLHRIDENTPLEESIPALAKLRSEGKTRFIGLSECSAATLRKADSSELAWAGVWGEDERERGEQVLMVVQSRTSTLSRSSTPPGRRGTSETASLLRPRSWAWRLSPSRRWVVVS